MKRDSGVGNLVAILLVVILSAPWFVNLFKTFDCDFESPYRCEVIHGIGVIIPPAAYITVWFDTDNFNSEHHNPYDVD